MKNQAQALIAVALAFSFAFPASAFAGDSLKSVCSDDNATAQKQSYCKAAKSAQKGADTNGKLWKVYGAVTAVCTTACVTSMIPGWQIAGADWTCMGSSVGAAGVDAIWTKEYSTALMGIAGAGVGIFMKANGLSLFGGGNAAQQAATIHPGPQGAATDPSAAGGGQSTDWGSCISAASAAFSTYMKFQNQKDEEKTVQDNLKQAKALASTTTVATNNSNVTAAGSGGGGATATQNGTTSPATAGAEMASNSSKPSSCDAESTDAAAAIQCAVSTDPNIPAFVTSPQFARDFQKASGMNLNDYMSKAQNPTQAIGSGVSAAMGTDGANMLTGQLTAMSSRFDSMNQGEMYYASGAGSHPRAGGEDFNQMMNSLMSQFAPKKEEDKAKGVNAVAFSYGIRRTPASGSPEDKNVSLFDRIAFRYASVAPRMVETQQVQLKTW